MSVCGNCNLYKLACVNDEYDCRGEYDNLLTKGQLGGQLQSCAINVHHIIRFYEQFSLIVFNCPSASIHY